MRKAHCNDSHALSCLHAALQRHLRQMGQQCCRALGYCSKKSSRLRAALARALRLEAAVAQGFEAAGFLWDMSAFFDSIDLADLIEFALDMAFPSLS